MTLDPIDKIILKIQFIINHCDFQDIFSLCIIRLH